MISHNGFIQARGLHSVTADLWCLLPSCCLLDTFSLWFCHVMLSRLTPRSVIDRTTHAWRLITWLCSVLLRCVVVTLWCAALDCFVKFGFILYYTFSYKRNRVALCLLGADLCNSGEFTVWHSYLRAGHVWRWQCLVESRRRSWVPWEAAPLQGHAPMASEPSCCRKPATLETSVPHTNLQLPSCSKVYEYWKWVRDYIIYLGAVTLLGAEFDDCSKLNI